jgi:predicted HTH domain antitoxin
MARTEPFLERVQLMRVAFESGGGTNMAITLALPEEIEEYLESHWNGDLQRKILEAIAVEAYREKTLGITRVRRLLGFEDRWETIRFLSERGVYPNYDEEDFEKDQRTLASLDEKTSQ